MNNIEMRISPGIPVSCRQGYYAGLLAALLVLLPVTSVNAGPEEDRLGLLKSYQTRFPDIRMDDYIHGALVFDPDAKAQYQSIMEFPPFLAAQAKGEAMWRTPLRSGRSYADCMPNQGRLIAGNYPMFDAEKGRVVTFEDLINDCRVANGEPPYAPDDGATMGLLTAYARSLSDGMKMNIRVDTPEALKAYEDGKRTFYARTGQLNFSCANCHVDHAGDKLRSEHLSMAIGHATHWPVFRAGDVPYTLQARYALCYQLMRHVPDAPGSERMNNLEYFHAYLSNGLTLHASVFRK